jgi:hypothetical protein
MIEIGGYEEERDQTPDAVGPQSPYSPPITMPTTPPMRSTNNGISSDDSDQAPLYSSSGRMQSESEDRSVSHGQEDDTKAAHERIVLVPCPSPPRRSSERPSVGMIRAENPRPRERQRDANSSARPFEGGAAHRVLSSLVPRRLFETTTSPAPTIITATADGPTTEDDATSRRIHQGRARHLLRRSIRLRIQNELEQNAERLWDSAVRPPRIPSPSPPPPVRPSISSFWDESTLQPLSQRPTPSQTTFETPQRPHRRLSAPDLCRQRDDAQPPMLMQPQQQQHQKEMDTSSPDTDQNNPQRSPSERSPARVQDFVFLQMKDTERCVTASVTGFDGDTYMLATAENGWQRPYTRLSASSDNWDNAALRTCLVCFESPANVVLTCRCNVPWICDECANRVNMCPICKECGAHVRSGLIKRNLWRASETAPQVSLSIVMHGTLCKHMSSDSIRLPAHLPIMVQLEWPGALLRSFVFGLLCDTIQLSLNGDLPDDSVEHGCDPNNFIIVTDSQQPLDAKATLSEQGLRAHSIVFVSFSR